MASHRRKRPNGSNNNCVNDHTSNNNNNNNNNNKDEQKPEKQSINKSSSFTATTRLRGRTRSRKKDDYDDNNDDSDNDNDDDDVPFCCLTLKVGTVLAIIMAICCIIFGTSRVYYEMIATISSSSTIPPNWIVSSKDAFGIAHKYQLDDILQQFNNNHQNSNNNNNSNSNSSKLSSAAVGLHSFLIESAAMRKQFQQRYGRHARSLLGHGISSILDIDNDDASNSNNAAADNYNNDGLTILAQTLADKRRENQGKRELQNSEFRILVLGNAAAAGYGNYHSQAYSYILQRLLQPSFKAMLNMTLTVTNLAMDGVLEFPSSWCLSSSFPLLPDVIIWDFPTSSVQRLEAFIRHWSLVVAVNNNNTTAPPLLIFREHWKDDENTGKKKKKNKGVDDEEKKERSPRLTLLKYYRQANVLSDATLLVHEVQATRPFFEHAQQQQQEASALLPRGLADWHKFGGPAGASSLDHIHAHLSLQQHQLVAWLVGMHFLAALELLAARDLHDINNATSATTTTGNQKKKKSHTSPILLLDKKKRRTLTTTTALPKPLFLKNVEWMDDLSRSSAAITATGSSQQCYTTLEYMVRDHSMKPIMTTTTSTTNEAEATAVFVDEGHGQAIQQVDSVYIPSNLHELLLPLDGTNNSGNNNTDSSSTIGQDSELLLPKSGQWYNHHGWVLDMDTLTKRHKQQTRSSDFLGFADWKKAYFGAYGSGPLRLFLPVPLANDDGGETTAVVAASNAVKVLILCELSPFNEDDRPSDPGKFRKRLPKPQTTTASCTLREDVSITVGGITTTTKSLESIGSSTMTPSLYDAPLQPNCRHVVIPPAARLMTRTQAMVIADDKKSTMSIRDEVQADNGEYGLLVELTVTNPRVVWNQGPCSLSHVIYQPQ